MRAVSLLCLLAALGHPNPARAQVPKQDSIHVTGQADMGAPALSGGKGGLEWLHALSPASTLDLGAFSVAVGDSSWTYGRIGGVVRRRSVSWWGMVDLGAGRGATESFAYHRYDGGAIVAVRPQRLYAEIELQRIRLGREDVRAIGTTVQAQPIPRVTARVGYHVAVMPATKWQYLSVRSDVRLGGLTALGGFTFGDAGSRLSFVPSWVLAIPGSREFFTGASVTRTLFDVTGVVSVVRGPAGSVGRVAVALGIRVGSNRRPDVIDR